MEILCKRLKELRVKNNLTQSEFGNIIGVKKGTICYYEQGRNIPSFETLTKLADHFNISLDYFAGHDDFAISDKGSKYNTSMCNEEIRFIKELRKDNKLYKELITNPENLVSRMKIKL